MGQGSSVRVAMVMAAPMTLEGRQRGHRTSTAAHGPAVAVATSSLGCSEILRSQEQEGEEGGGGWWENPSAFILKEEEGKKTRVSFSSCDLQT